ncbi:MAG: hypothetical protein JW729_02485 [Bacteroidales bacterium]|nr:hypothetical protein [Bacteroidales bacterium]
MKNYLLVLQFIAIAITGYGQKTNLATIKRVQTFEQKFSKGAEENVLIEEKSYDTLGQLIELKEFDAKGNAVVWEKYIYDENGNLIEELFLNSKGKIEKKEVTQYQNNLKISREFFDSEGRLYKKKTYEYELR